VAVVLGLDHGQGDVELVEQCVVGAQHRGLVPVGLLAANDNAARSQWELAIDLVHTVPASCLHGRADVFVADVAFGEILLVHRAPWARIEMVCV
jgi:hypothetical protein